MAFAAALSLHAAPKPFDPLASLPEPPPDAIAGTPHDGVQIGLWSQKIAYSGSEIRNVWIFARKSADSPISIDGGGDFFKESFLYLTSNDHQAAKIPETGPVDSFVGSTSFAGGISGPLASLPPGDYIIIWKTNKLESNHLAITLK